MVDDDIPAFSSSSSPQSSLPDPQPAGPDEAEMEAQWANGGSSGQVKADGTTPPVASIPAWTNAQEREKRETSTKSDEDIHARVRDFISGEPRGNETVKSITIDFSSDKQLEGYQESALECIYKAALIAHDLNHTHVNAGHLILALSLDGRAALGMERRKLPVEEIRKAMLRDVLDQEWRFKSSPQLTTSAKLSLILGEASRRAAERDDRAASLPDLLDVLESLHAEGRLLPGAETDQNKALAGLQASLADEFQKLRSTLDEGMSQQNTQLEAAAEAVNRAKEELLRALAKPEPQQRPTPPTSWSTPRETPAQKESIIERLREGFSSKVAVLALL